MRLDIICMICLIQGAIPHDAPPYPFMDPTLPWDKRVDDLVNRLTLEEIVPQTIARGPTKAIPRLGIKPYIWGTECVRGQVSANTTAFPQAIGLAATFNKHLMHDMSETISYELRAQWNIKMKQHQYKAHFGLSCFSPVINIMRHPLWGRNQETYGEDPYLSGSLSQHFVWGLHGDDPRFIRANGGCKHFDVHGGPDKIPVSRFSFDSKVSTRDWRMTFLPQFKMCVEAGTYSLMCSYNSINGVPACANKELLTDIARKEWGFKGFVVSDAWAITFIMTKHHFTNSCIDTVVTTIKAGVNLQLETGCNDQQINAMKQGKLTEQEIRDNVKPLFYTRMRLGEFDPPDKNPWKDIDYTYIQSTSHRSLALKLAMQSFVLLKNEDDFLPLKKQFSSIAVIGPMSNNTDQMFGDYASIVVPQFTTTPLEGLQSLAETLNYAAGCSDNHCKTYHSEDIKTAVQGTGLIVVCLGLGTDIESEGIDRADINLPGKHLKLLQDAETYGYGTPIILVLFNAGPLDITYAKESAHVAAILEVFYPAQSTGEALYNVLTMSGGPDSVPAGRLPATWPAYLSQVLPITNYTMEGRTYRYYNGDPLYAFGYGLSYSQFEYKDMVIHEEIKQGDLLGVAVTVENHGPYEAQEVVQLYITWPKVTVPVPKLQLVDYDRIQIADGGSKRISFFIKPDQMSVWMDDTTGWKIPTGDYKLFIGGQQPGQKMDVGSNVLVGTFNVKEK